MRENARGDIQEMSRKSAVLFQDIGPRSEQQDVFSENFLPNGDRVFLMADGHGFGGYSAAFCAVEETKKALNAGASQLETFTQLLKDGGGACGSFLWWNNLFRSLNEKIMRQTKNAGTSLTVSLVRDGVILTVHVGDSQSRVFRADGGQSKTLAVPHRPTEKHERIRLQRSDARILNKRLVTGFGSLAMSRALGYPEGGDILCEPNISRYVVTPNDRFLVIGTDGLSDVLFERMLLRNKIEQELSDLQSASAASEYLSDMIFKNGGFVDNTTYAVVDLYENR